LHALIAAQANLNVNDVVGAATVVKRALSTWPHDPRFLRCLFSLVRERPGGELESIFEENLKANIADMGADDLTSYINCCFQLGRPDLAWLVYLSLQRVDSRDPALYLAPVQFGGVWLTFRRHQIGIEAENKKAKIDLKPFYSLTRNMKPFKSFWDRVPLTDELAGADIKRTRSKYLTLCLDELKQREEEGRLLPRMQMMYSTTLAMAGRYEEAHARLNVIEREYTERKKDVYFQRAVFYDEQHRWQDLYESLVKYNSMVNRPNLKAGLMMVNALMNLNLGFCAMEVAERTRRAFPGSREADYLAAVVWDAFGFMEQALFVLSSDGA